MNDYKERISRFLTHINKDDDKQLQEMKAYAVANHVPIIKDEMRHLVDTLIAIHKPKKILEIGTAIGYSSIMMAKSMEGYKEGLEYGSITTIERSDEMYKRAIENVKHANKEDVIQICHDDAAVVLEEFVKQEEIFDLIFMDAAKGQYLTFLPHCLKLLRKDGVLISDNVLQNGDVIESRFGVSRRQRTIHQRMREYLWTLNHTDSLKTSILNVADGATISVKLVD